MGSPNRSMHCDLGLTGRAEDDDEMPGCEAYSPEYDYYSDEEEEEGYSEYVWDEAEFEDIRDCICDITEISDETIAEVTVDEEDLEE